MVAGIILAAGRSCRMGRSKALLATPDGPTFVARLIQTLCGGGVDVPLVVGRPDDDPLRSEVESAGARFVINPDADAGGQLSSLLAGLRQGRSSGHSRRDGNSGRCADGQAGNGFEADRRVQGHSRLDRSSALSGSKRPSRDLFARVCSTNCVTPVRRSERRPCFARTRTTSSTSTSTILVWRRTSTRRKTTRSW